MVKVNVYLVYIHKLKDIKQLIKHILLHYKVEYHKNIYKVNYIVFFKYIYLQNKI